MSNHRDVFKVVACLTVIGLTAAPAYKAQAQQTTQQANCNLPNPMNCGQNNSNGDPKYQGAGPYDSSSMYFAPGARDVTHANPASQKGSKQREGSSGN